MGVGVLGRAELTGGWQAAPPPPQALLLLPIKAAETCICHRAELGPPRGQGEVTAHIGINPPLKPSWPLIALWADPSQGTTAGVKKEAAYPWTSWKGWVVRVPPPARPAATGVLSHTKADTATF